MGNSQSLTPEQQAYQQLLQLQAQQRNQLIATQNAALIQLTQQQRQQQQMAKTIMREQELTTAIANQQQELKNLQVKQYNEQVAMGHQQAQQQQSFVKQLQQPSPAQQQQPQTYPMTPSAPKQHSKSAQDIFKSKDVQPSNADCDCYGALPTSTCCSCEQVVQAYNTKGWAYDKTNFKQCQQQPSSQ